MATLQPSEGHRAQFARPPQSDSRCFEGAVCCRTTLTHEDLCCVSRPILKSNPLIFMSRSRDATRRTCCRNPLPLPQSDSRCLKSWIVPVVLRPAASASPSAAPAAAAAVVAPPPFGSVISGPQSSSLSISIGRPSGCSGKWQVVGSYEVCKW